MNRLQSNSVNQAWSLRLLRLLYQSGVRHFCIAPGSRSAPLTLAAEKLSHHYPDLTLHVHFDERGLGFFALGLIRALEAPVAVITTSGTAVANLLPATVEAFQSQKPLILVTADRPQELIDCGANQAIHQVGILGSFAPTQIVFQTTPDQQTVTAFDQQWHGIAQQMAKPLAQQSPIHINCPFRDPLYPDHMQLDTDTQAVTDRWLSRWPQQISPVSTRLPTAVDSNTDKRVLVVLGELRPLESALALAWAETQGLPVLADFVSGQRLSSSSALLAYPELLLATTSGQSWLEQFDKVLQFGGRITGKRLGQWLAESSNDYVIISPSTMALDPSHRATQIMSEIDQYCAAQQTFAQVALLSAQVVASMSQLIEHRCAEAFSELSAVTGLCRWLPDHTQLFAGNSLAIRWINSVAPQLSGQHTTYCQRGASGIDGLIATAVGIAQGSQRRLVALLGDTAALHDLNSLALAAHCTTPLILIINNNGGGSIFNLLPASKFPNANRTLFRCEHQWAFSGAAAMFGLPYQGVATQTAFTDALAQAANHQGATVIECAFSPVQATDLYQQLIKDLSAL